MLSIGKLSSASVGYYTDQLTHSVGEDVPVLRGDGVDRQVDYYASHESPARWMGSGLTLAGVDGSSPVTAEAFARLMRHETLAAESMTRARASHGSVAGFDHTFSAPKSVSLMYAYGSPDIRGQVRAAHLEAVAEAVGYMERHASHARVGTRWRDDAGRWHVRTETVESEGWVAAAFDHFTSRANDPQLHTHVVVINQVHTDDGWRALDARSNYRHAKAGGTVYEAFLRDQLTRRLGVTWREVVNGIADIEGFTPELLAHFSTRRAEILEAVDKYVARHGGQPHRRMLQAFTLETRQPKRHPRGDPAVTVEMKDYGVGPEIDAHWTLKALDSPQDPAELVRQVVTAGRLGVRPDDAALVDRARRMVEALTDRQATFTERDLLAHVASLYPDGAKRAELEHATTLMLAATLDTGHTLTVLAPGGGDGVRLPDGVTLTTDELARLVDARSEAVEGDGNVRFRGLPGEARYTTRLQLEREHRVLAAVRAASPVTVDPAAFDDAIAHRGLVAEQAEGMRRLALLEGRLVAVVGPGGSGKTYAIAAYADAAHAAGHHVIGVAPTAMATHKLGQDLDGRWCGTIGQLTHHLDTHREQLPTGTVIVCDEASMVSTRDLAHLVDHVTQAEGKLVLLGDPAQLPSIDSGALFHRIVSERHGVVFDLEDVNHRQILNLDRTALTSLRTGDANRAVYDYIEAGRLHLGDRPDDTLTAMVDAWWNDITSHDLSEVRMLAARRHDVDQLNRLARTRTRTEDRLEGPALTTRWGDVFQAGDRIVVRDNWYGYHDLRNGQTGTVTTVDPDAGSMMFRRDSDGVEIVLPKRYVDASVDYGYAQTIHTAQGQTYTRTHLYLDTGADVEHAYTGLSRARGETHLWLSHTPGPGDCHHGAPIVEDRIDILCRQLQRSGIETPAPTDPGAVRGAADSELVALRDDLARTLRAGPLAFDPTEEIAGLDQAITHAHHIGTRPHQIRHLEQQRQELVDQLDQRAARIEDHADLVHRYTAVVDELDRRVTARSILYRHDPPADLIAVLGPRTIGPAAHHWDAAATEYARARIETGPDVDLLDHAATVARRWQDLNRPALDQPTPTLRRLG